MRMLAGSELLSLLLRLLLLLGAASHSSAHHKFSQLPRKSSVGAEVVDSLQILDSGLTR